MLPLQIKFYNMPYDLETYDALKLTQILFIKVAIDLWIFRIIFNLNQKDDLGINHYKMSRI